MNKCFVQEEIATKEKLALKDIILKEDINNYVLLKGRKKVLWVSYIIWHTRTANKVYCNMILQDEKDITCPKQIAFALHEMQQDDMRFPYT